MHDITTRDGLLHMMCTYAVDIDAPLLYTSVIEALDAGIPASVVAVHLRNSMLHDAAPIVVMCINR